jgi:hypothetical protein
MNPASTKPRAIQGNQNIKSDARLPLGGLRMVHIHGVDCTGSSNAVWQLDIDGQRLRVVDVS